MQKFEIFADVRPDGTLSSVKRLEAHQAIKMFSGKRIRLTVERAFSKRSNEQNRYFHGVCVPIVAQGLVEIGYNEARSMEWAKDFIKANLLTTEIPDKDGVMWKVIRPTSGLSKSQFMDLIADLQQWAMDNIGVYIPDPNEQTELF